MPASRHSLFGVALLAALSFGAASGARAQVDPGRSVLADDCITNVQPNPQGQPRRFQCRGDEVSFFVDISAQCARGGCGLIANIPGATQTATSLELVTGLMRRAREDQAANASGPGFLVISAQRDIAGRAQPAFNTAFQGGSADEIFRFMQRAAKVFAVDTNRIHIGGFSQGGFITFNFLCDRQKSAFISSAAPQAATPRTGNVTCFGPAASGAVNPDVPFVFTSGRLDRVVDFSMQQAAQQAIVASLQPVRSMQVIDQGPTDFTRTRVVGNDGRTVDLILHSGTSARLGGHCFVGADRNDGGGCNPPSPFMNGQVSFEFFKANPRNPMRPRVQLPN